MKAVAVKADARVVSRQSVRPGSQWISLIAVASLTKVVRVCRAPFSSMSGGNGFSLTDAATGVSFDLNADGTTERISWTAAAADDYWLVLDRNGNGAVDDGSELFGNHTPQPQSAGVPKNGFLALAQLDEPLYGGNGDGFITSADSVFNSLRLWQDANHNGVSEPDEISSLTSKNIQTLELNYKASRRTDEYGNEFRYRAKVKDANGSQVGRWAWDVFLVSLR